MQLTIMVLVAVVLSVAGCAYLAWFDSKEAAQKSLTWKSFLPKGKRLAFTIVMLLGLVGVSVALQYIYGENRLLQNTKLICLLGLLFLAANVDARKEIIPNTLILAGLILRVVYWVLELCYNAGYLWLTFKDELLACAILGVFFLLCGLIVKGGIGMGDIKLVLVMCLFQGLSGVLSSLFCALFAAFVVTIGLLITKKKTRKDAIPFAPSILLGALVSIVLTGI